MGAVSRSPYAIGWVRGRALRSLTIGHRTCVYDTLRVIARGNGRTKVMCPLTEGEYLALVSWPIFVWVVVLIVVSWNVW